MQLTQEQMVTGIYNKVRGEVDGPTKQTLRDGIAKQVAWAFEQLGNPDTADMDDLDPYMKESTEIRIPI